LIFEPYFSTKLRGTGLGLAIVAQIVADHRGYIRLRDNEPNGCRFVVELPALASPRPDARAAIERTDRAPQGPAPVVSP
jgi:signal transduction histidine kinase